MPDSDSSSSASSRHSSPELHSKKKGAKLAKRPAAQDPAEKGDNWDFTPPAGSILLEDNPDLGDFDWDAVKNNDDLELWLVRVPDSVKSKHMHGLQIDVPSSSKGALVGSLKRKHVTFDVWSVGDDSDTFPAGGEELQNMSCLLPRKNKKGKLYPAPKPFARKIVFSAQPVVPNGEDQVSNANPPRFSYPQECLKHRFLPYGSLNLPSNDVVMNDTEPTSSKKGKSSTLPESTPDAASPEEGKKKGKKRKGEAEADSIPAPKKSKKSKVSS